MSNWIKHPVILEGEKVILSPLQEEHFDELINNSQNELIWTYMPVNGMNKALLHSVLKEALIKQNNSEQYPFVIIDKKNHKIIGSTRYLQLNEEHRNLEIGYSWYLPEYWGKGYNEESKFLLLNHCFEVLKTVRVQLIASDKNLRSRKAILRIGAQFEGILRSVIIRNGEKKNIAYYSILEEEWALVKKELHNLFIKKYSNPIIE